MPALASWQEIEPALDQALGLASTERSLWLSGLSERSPELAEEVRALLAEDAQAEHSGFLAGVAEAALTGVELGAYRLSRPLGEGGMGSVWLGVRADGQFEGVAAIKLLHQTCLTPVGQARFRREGSLLARLQHPSIAKLLDAGVSPAGQPFLVLEYIDGQPIDTFAGKRELGRRERIELLLQVLAAVEHAHTNLVIHRDLKPANILVTVEGTVKLLDFGIAKLLDDQARATGTATFEGRAFTPLFASPEQVLGDALTTATDVYALGVLLYVLLSGRHPTSEGASSVGECTRAVLEREPAPLGLGDLDSITLQALKKSPDERYASARALADDLRAYLAHRPVSACADGWRYRTAKFLRRHRVPVGLALAALGALVIALTAVVVQARRATQQAEEALLQRRRADEAASHANRQREFAFRQLLHAQAVNDLDQFLLSDAAPGGKPLSVGELLARAEQMVDRQYGEDAATQVEMLTAIGRQYDVQDEDGHALRVLTRAYERSNVVTDPATRAKTACALAKAVAMSGELERAEALVLEGVGQLPDVPELVLARTFCLLRGSEVARERGAQQLAIERSLEAQRRIVDAKLNSPRLDLQVHMDLAESYRVAGRLHAAGTEFASAWERLEAMGRGNTERASTLLNNWGLTLHMAGQPRDAERAFRRAIAIEEAPGNDAAVSPMLLLNLARPLTELERYAEALRYIAMAQARGKAVGHELLVNQALRLRASVYRSTGELERAEQTLAELDARIQGAMPPGHPMLAALALERALLARARGQRQAAAEAANTSIAIAEQSDNAEILPRFLVQRSSIALDAGDLARAEADARRALERLPALLDPELPSSLLGQAWLALARALRAQSRDGEARMAAAQALARLEPTLGAEHSETRAARSSRDGAPK